jgi:16S rRNA (cytidine1402-2'-O)-methyltransferase
VVDGQSGNEGELYVVAVPIGNLEDITLRALRILKSVDLILCEDTRTTGKLLELLGVPKRPLMSLHEHNESGRSATVIEKLRSGLNLALVSDAGTPAISDPGQRLIRAVADEEIRVTPLPGPCALITALCASGLASRTFLFLGFPPTKTGAIQRLLTEHVDTPHTLIFYVGPHHLNKFLEQAVEVLGEDRPAIIGRELTKKFEEFIRGSLSAIVQAMEVVRGEVVVLIQGQLNPAPPTDTVIELHLKRLLEQGEKPSVAARTVAKTLGCSRDEVYQIGLKLKDRIH